MFEVIQPVPRCFLFLFDKQKDLSLTFCRVQEYYESPKDELKDKFFTLNEFIDASMDDDGFIDYFNFWSGFNIPGNVYLKWIKLNNDKDENLSKHEFNLYIKTPDDGRDFYIIGALKKDKKTINHEIAHALYHLNLDYKSDMFSLTEDFAKNNKKEFDRFVKELKNLGYCDSVTYDEIQAYMSTSPKKELVEDFKINCDNLDSLIKKYKKVLRKYNT